MFKIALLGQKGGTGKTTIALGVAVAAAAAGHMTAVIDLDPQASASRWKDRRTPDNPAVVSAQASRLHQAMATAETAGAEFVIVDTAGRSDSSMLEAARIADLVLIPTRPNIVEIETLPQVNDLLRVAGVTNAFVVLNGLHPSAGQGTVGEARNVLSRYYSLPTAPVHLCHRNAYAEAMITGSTPQELDPDGKAGAELSALFRFVRDNITSKARAA